MTMPTFEQVDAALHYDPDTGIITRKAREWAMARVNTRYADKPAGGTGSGGYLNVMLVIGGKRHSLKCHRVAWLLQTGEWPTAMIDHKDRDKTNNRWCNLRLADDTQNNANKPCKAKSGYKGVEYRPKLGKWTARITLKRKTIYLGLYDTPEAAHQAYRAEAEKLFGEFAHHLSSPQ